MEDESRSEAQPGPAAADRYIAGTNNQFWTSFPSANMSAEKQEITIVVGYLRKSGNEWHIYKAVEVTSTSSGDSTPTETSFLAGAHAVPHSTVDDLEEPKNYDPMNNDPMNNDPENNAPENNAPMNNDPMNNDPEKNDPEDYDPEDYDPEDYDPEDYDSEDFDHEDHDPEAYDPEGYEPEGYDPQACDPEPGPSPPQLSTSNVKSRQIDQFKAGTSKPPETSESLETTLGTVLQNLNPRSPAPEHAKMLNPSVIIQNPSPTPPPTPSPPPVLRQQRRPAQALYTPPPNRNSNEAENLSKGHRLRSRPTPSQSALKETKSGKTIASRHSTLEKKSTSTRADAILDAANAYTRRTLAACWTITNSSC